RLVQRVRVVEGTAADAGAGEDHHVLQQVDPLHAEQPQLRGPQVLVQPPAGLRELLILETAAGLDHADAVALLRQPQRRDRPAEPRTDHEHVVIPNRHVRTPFLARARPGGRSPRPGAPPASVTRLTLAAPLPRHTGFRPLLSDATGSAI